MDEIVNIRTEAGFRFESCRVPLVQIIGEMFNPEHPGNIQVKIAADFFADAFRTTGQTGFAAGLDDNDYHGF